MRIDMATSEWHQLVKPVLPHITKDAEFPELSQVRIEIGATSLYAVATDRYTLGAERRPLARTDRHQPQPPVHVRATDVQASLKLFSYAKDDDPPLTLTIDTVLIPSEVMGEHGSYSAMAVTLQSAIGGRLVMHDRRMTGRDPLQGWQRVLSAAMSRQQGGTLSGLDLSAALLGRWAAAVRHGERLTFWTGSRRKDSILVTVDTHFAGLWAPDLWGSDGAPPPDPAGLPWVTELDAGIDLRTASGLLADPGNGDEDGEPE